jgi:hypothetical protein
MDGPGTYGSKRGRTLKKKIKLAKKTKTKTKKVGRA